MPREMTFRQREVLEMVQTYWNEFRLPPSLDDLASRLDLERTTVHQHLLALKSKGFLSHIEGAGRTWRPATEPKRASVRIPILGTVAAGSPIWAIENIEGWVSIADVNESDRFFALRVKGDDLVEHGILDGDIAIARSQGNAEVGDLVVVDADGDATITRLNQSGNALMKTKNVNFEPSDLQGNRARILGRVIGVQRRFS
jgi:repressor LexA